MVPGKLDCTPVELIVDVDVKVVDKKARRGGEQWVEVGRGDDNTFPVEMDEVFVLSGSRDTVPSRNLCCVLEC